MTTHNQKPSSKLILPQAALWAGAGALALGLLFAVAVYPELVWLSVVLGVLLVAALAALVKQNAKALSSKTAAYGLYSGVIIALVISLLAVLNFLAYRYPQKLDLTKGGMHTLSEQTVKVVKGLAKPVEAVLFGTMKEREQFRPLLENYKSLNTKFEIEYVDPNREPTRAKQAGIKKLGTLQLQADARESKVEDPNEEKLTNALIKLTRDRTPTLCAITGHGERSFSSREADGYEAVKKALNGQSYEVKDLNLLQDAQDGKIPATCDALAIMGPAKPYFEPEAKAVREYLRDGGRAVIALDLNLNGSEPAPELVSILAEWYIKPAPELLVDPLSKMLGVDASVPILASYSKENPITKEMENSCYFPLSRPIDQPPGAPASLKVQWLAQTTPKSWAASDLRALARGEARYERGKDRSGPLSAVVAVDGKLKDSKAARDTRLVVFGTSHFATNQYGRFGANQDLFLNSVSWIMDDEKLISIRAKEEVGSKIELSQKQGTTIFILTVIVIPLLTAVAGVVFWVYRRRL